jgi:PAS domain S-box-containing protein
VIATDQTGAITFLNPIAEDLTGWKVDDAKGLPVAEAFPIFNEYTHHPVENPVSKVLELGNIIGLANHTVLRHRNGMFTPIEDSAAPIRDDRGRIVGVVLVFRDASKERKSHLVKGMPDLPQSAHAPLEMVEHELDRVSHITRQTLGFYRESAVPGRVEIPTLIENILRLYSSKLKAKNIQLDREFQDCPPVQGLAGELTQAISNLISNAADAAPQDGTVIVSLAPIESAGRRWVELQVKDSGPGIPPEIEPRIFEPFFTTKTDVGTGLGLWVTKEIVDRHGGHIEVRRGSAEDGVANGAVFRITLPAAPVQG